MLGVIPCAVIGFGQPVYVAVDEVLMHMFRIPAGLGSAIYGFVTPDIRIALKLRIPIGKLLSMKNFAQK
jgi:hypothetical protein